MADYIAISVWGYCFICYKGTPRPDNEIKQDTILTPFLSSIVTVSSEDEKHSLFRKNENSSDNIHRAIHILYRSSKCGSILMKWIRTIIKK